MNRFFKQLQLKLTLTCIVGLAVVIAVIHAAVYLTARNIIEDQMGLSSQSIAMAVSAYIMEDTEGYKRFLGTRDTESDYYRHMQEYFSRVKNKSNIKYIYTERKIDDETVEFILDAEPVGSKDYSPPGSTTFMDSAGKEAYETGLPAKLEIVVHPQYGTLVGGCAPIFDEDGALLGLVGVNLDISEMYGQLNTMQLVMILIYAAIIALALLLLKKYSRAILEPMLKDKLTGAYNRRYLEKIMQAEMKAALQRRSELAILMLDLDHFKKINDTYGHEFGDVVLSTVSSVVMGCLKKTDFFFRYGGEEFIVMIAKTDAETVFRIAERIRLAVAAAKIKNEEPGRTVRITVSIGIARLGGAQGNWETLVLNADKALYDAKRTRNSVSVFR